MQHDVVLVLVLITFAKAGSAFTRIYESDENNETAFSQKNANIQIDTLTKKESLDIDAHHKIVTEDQHREFEFVNINDKSTKVKIKKFKDIRIKARERPVSKKHDIIFNKELHSIKKRSKRNDDNCAKLYERYRKGKKPEKLVLAVGGRLKKIYVNSTARATSKALAALLIAAIRYRAGYYDSETVFHDTNNKTIGELANSILKLSKDQSMVDTMLHIHVDADWDEKVGGLPGCTPKAYQCGLAGTRLTEIRKAPSVNVRVYAALSNKSLETCNFTSRYLDITEFESCVYNSTEQSNINNSSSCIPVLLTRDVETTLVTESKTFVNNVKFCVNSTTRQMLNNRLKYDLLSSFIFIDYELDYEKIYEKRVRIVPTPLREPKFAMQLADIFLFRLYAPYVVNILKSVRPQANVLREILEFNENSGNIQDSACAWAYEHEKDFEYLTDFTTVKLHFIFILCNDSEAQDYEKFITDVLHKKLNPKLKGLIHQFDFNLIIQTYNCRDKKTLCDQMSRLKSNSVWKDTAGLAVPGSVMDTINIGIDDVQVISYDIPPSDSKFKNSLSKVSGDLQNLVLAIVYFLKKHGWSRIAIISENSSLAKSFKEELGRHVKQYTEKILLSSNVTNIRQILTNYEKVSAKIFFLNTGPEAANKIACEAANLGMTDVNEYAWIAREWRPYEKNKCDVQVFTVSYWWHGNISLPNGVSNDIRKELYEGYTDESWPILAAPMATALELMVFRTEYMLSKNSSRFFDLHLKEPFSKYDEYLDNVDGVVQKLERRNDTQLNPFVFVSAWRGVAVSPVAVWQIKSETHDIFEINSIYEPYKGGKRPDDNKSRCLTATGDDFFPTCLDAVWISGLALVLLVPLAAWRVLRFRKMEQEKKKRLTLMRLLSRCKRTAALLEPYLVDRSQLELFEELGSGHFGRVRFGMLRGKGGVPTPVAAKTIREDAAPAEEAEFLREASTMATLSHDHIVAVVGVCTDTDGPPLLLMEHAFFGDLLKYLRKRKHLVEINERDSYISVVEVVIETDSNKPSDPEAHYVSPPQLTRLGREAAEALNYLASHHILHRDVRAANCLVDARRVLKLADFGMARNVEQKNESPLDDPEDDDYKYICRRRGVFPVSWMAPESLDRGEFSRASDVWALGVLMLEISTLGARPYGSWKPLQVLNYVRSGGRPPLPRDATYHMLEVTEMCWNELPSKRATAKEISEYLFLHPMALRGALRPAWPEPELVPDSSDSGWSSERDPDHDWSKDVDLKVATL